METMYFFLEEYPEYRFKSYYVVWKLESFHKWQKMIIGLNRTMQYGNRYSSTAPNPNISFKSYYVVWKQQEWKEIDDGKDGLNRTMQYGNLESMRHRFEECFV